MLEAKQGKFFHVLKVGWRPRSLELSPFYVEIVILGIALKLQVEKSVFNFADLHKRVWFEQHALLLERTRGEVAYVLSIEVIFDDTVMDLGYIHIAELTQLLCDHPQVVFSNRLQQARVHSLLKAGSSSSVQTDWTNQRADQCARRVWHEATRHLSTGHLAVGVFQSGK